MRNFNQQNNPYRSYSNQSFWDGIKHSFQQGSNLTKLIYINLGVFVVVKILSITAMLFNLDIVDVVMRHLMVPADTNNLLWNPWTVFTYMFLHEGFLHLLMNMLWLYWFGRIFISFLDQKKLLSVYLLGGLTGAALYIFAYNIFPYFQSDLPLSYALGASASVMAIVFGVTFYAPNHQINLVFIGRVKIKYIALFFIFTDLMYIDKGVNIGGHIAHLGGAFYGWLFAVQMRKANDITKGFNDIMDWIFAIFKPRKKMNVSFKDTNKMTDREYNKAKKNNSDEINRILEKVAKSGYESLTKEEKATLFKSSNS